MLMAESMEPGMLSAAAVHAETKLLLTVKKKYYIN
jgi:hypothetical protein